MRLIRTCISTGAAAVLMFAAATEVTALGGPSVDHALASDVGPLYDVQCNVRSGSHPGGSRHYWCAPGGQAGRSECTSAKAGQVANGRNGSKWKCNRYKGAWKTSGPISTEYGWRKVSGCISQVTVKDC